MLDELKIAFPNFEVASQYCPVTSELWSTICFYNFYDQIFDGAGIAVDLHLCFFDEDGKEIDYIRQEVKPRGFCQFETLSRVKHSRGMVGVLAAPRADLGTISRGRLKLRESIGTGFYITWNGFQGHIDVMHEWLPLLSTPTDARTYYLGLNGFSEQVRWGALLMNRVASGDQRSVATPTVEVVSPDRRVLGRIVCDPIRSLGTRLLDLSATFPQINDWLRRYKTCVIKITGHNLADPLSVEWHSSGDFHFHHI